MDNSLKTAFKYSVFWAGFFVLYTYLRGTNFSYDGMCYALDVEFGNWPALFHPNHLFYSPLNRLLYAIASLFHGTTRALFVMMQANAAWSATANLVLYIALSKTYRPAPALLGAVLYGTSAVVWRETTDPGCYALASLAACFVLALLLSETRRGAAATGALHGLAAFFHLMIVLIAPAFVLKFFAQRATRRVGWTAVAFYTTALMGLVGLAYGLIGIFFYHGSIMAPFTDPHGTVAVRTFWVWNGLDNIKMFWSTFQSSWIGNSSSDKDREYFLWQTAVTLITIATLTGAAWSIKTKRCRWQLLSYSAWILSMSLLHFVWAVGAARFRILVFPAMVGFLLEVTRNVRIRRGVWVAVAAALIMFAIRNYRVTIRPYADLNQNRDYTRSLWIEKNLSGNDFLFFGGFGGISILNVYPAYFAHSVPARSLKGLYFSGVVSDFSVLDRYYDETMARNGRFFIDDELRHSTTLTSMRLKDFDLDRFATWLNRYDVAATLNSNDGYVVSQLVRKK